MIATITKGLILAVWLLGCITVVALVITALKLFEDSNHKNRKKKP